MLQLKSSGVFDRRSAITSEPHSIYLVGLTGNNVEAMQAVDEWILKDSNAVAREEIIVIQAGGLIATWGKNSPVFDYLDKREADHKMNIKYLFSRRESLILRAMNGDRRAAVQWLLSGAEPVLEAWGVSPDSWIEELNDRIPSRLSKFLSLLCFSVSVGRQQFICGSYSGQEHLPFGVRQAEIQPAVIPDGDLRFLVGADLSEENHFECSDYRWVESFEFGPSVSHKISRTSLVHKPALDRDRSPLQAIGERA